MTLLIVICGLGTVWLCALLVTALRAFADAPEVEPRRGELWQRLRTWRLLVGFLLSTCFATLLAKSTARGAVEAVVSLLIAFSFLGVLYVAFRTAAIIRRTGTRQINARYLPRRMREVDAEDAFVVILVAGMAGLAVVVWACLYVSYKVTALQYAGQ